MCESQVAIQDAKMDGNQAPLDRLGGYRVLRRIATGGTSDVLLAKAEGPLGFERQVVLKLLLSQYRDDDQFARMFAREAAAYARLSHASIVRLFDFFSQDDQLVMVLEFVDGSPLNRLRAGLKDIGRKLTDLASLHVADRVFDALAAAHGYVDANGNPSPVIHRDVNPSNVLVAWNGEVKLADFGIARVTGVRSDTQAGLIKGTFGYMAPEQVNGGDIGPHTDVYAAGILLWEMLAQRKAIQRGALPEIEILRAMAEPHIVALDILRPDLDRRLRDVVKATLEPDYRKRTITAEEVCRILRDVSAPSAGRGELLKLLRLAKDRDKVKKKLLSMPPPGAAEPSKGPAKASPKPPSVRPTAPNATSGSGKSGSGRPPAKGSASVPPGAQEIKRSAIDHVPAMLRPSTAPPEDTDGTEANLDLDKLFDGLALPDEDEDSLAGAIARPAVTLAGRDPETVSSSLLELEPDESAKELSQPARAPSPKASATAAAHVPRPPSNTEPLARPALPSGAGAGPLPDTVRPAQDARTTLVGSPSDRPPVSAAPPLPASAPSGLAKTAVSTQPMAARPAAPPPMPSVAENARTTVAQTPTAKAGDDATEPAVHADSTLAVATKSVGGPVPSATTTLVMGNGEQPPSNPPPADRSDSRPPSGAPNARPQEGFGSTQIMAQPTVPREQARPAASNISVMTPTPVPVPPFPSGVSPAPGPLPGPPSGHVPYVTKLDSGPGTILGGAAAPRPEDGGFEPTGGSGTPGLAQPNAPANARPEGGAPPKKSTLGRVVALLFVAALSAAGGVGYAKRARLLALIGKTPPPASASASTSATPTPKASASDDLAVGFSAGKDASVEDASLDGALFDAPAEASSEQDASRDASRDAALSSTAPDAAATKTVEAPDAAPPTGTATASATAKVASGMTAGPTTCIVNTSSAQPGHRIFYDGRVVGETPAALALPCGSHTIKLGSAGTPRTIDFPCGAEQAVGDR